MANIRIKDLPTATPTLSTDFFVFENLQGVNYVTSKNALSAIIASARGATGATGIQGNPGATGASGIQGNRGATGASGIQGNPGATGASGIQGNPGATGASGIQGNPGATGASGIQGNPGATGASGIQGAQGSTSNTVSLSSTTGSFTLSLDLSGRFVEANSSSTITITVTTDAAVPFNTGDQITFMRVGTGAVTFAGSGVTITSVESKLSLRAQYSVATLVKRGTNTWGLFGDLI